MKIRIVKTKDEKFKEKIHRIVHNGKEATKEFYNEHKVGIYIGGTMLLTVAGMGLDITKTMLRRRDAAMQDMRIYDRSLDTWWYLAKKLTTDQKLELNDRMKAGERMGDILRDLNVLRKK